MLGLVANAWAGFGAAFGPLVLLSLYYQKMTANGAVAGILIGALTIIVWEYGPFSWQGEPWSQLLYSMIPGFVLSTLGIILVSKWDNLANSISHRGA